MGFVNETMTRHHYFAVCFQSKVIGFLSVHPYRNGCELGYAFYSDYHGFGYASEALTTLLHYLKVNGCSACYVRIGLKNEPSVTLLSRNGFQCIDTENISLYTDENNHPFYFTGGIFANKLK